MASPSVSVKRADPAAILRQLLWLRQPGVVTELRALKVSTASYRRPHTVSGFFDADHLQGLARAAAQLSGQAKGVYVTLNPVHPDLLHRRYNTVDVAGEDELTRDTNVLRRDWLLIDADPVRDAHVSATDPEKALAGEVVRRVRDHLREEYGWPDPLLCDSDNGYHLLYRVDLPADDDHLVERILNALGERFDTPRVKIDRAVHNPARIVKLPGTLACKGSDTGLRPHRLARILEVPGRE